MHFQERELEPEWEEQLLATRDRLGDNRDVTGVDIGFQYQGLRPTGEISIRLFVVRKIPEADLPRHQKKNLHEQVKELGLDQFRLPFDILEMPLTGREPHPPEADRIARAATLQPGLSVSAASEGAGTLGAIVYTHEGWPALLTCAHVVAPEADCPGRPVFQPSPVDHGDVSFDMVARLHRQDRHLDAAVALLTGARMVRLAQLGTETLVAHARQVSRLGVVLTKSGRGTGITEGRVDGIGYYKLRQNNPELIWTPGFLLLPPDALTGGRELSAQGDSGALWYQQSGEGYGVGYGLHLTGERTQAEVEYAIATHLPLVLESLEVELLPPGFPASPPIFATPKPGRRPSTLQRSFPLRKERSVPTRMLRPHRIQRQFPPSPRAGASRLGGARSAAGDFAGIPRSSSVEKGEGIEPTREILRCLLGIPSDHHILFLPAGARLQFAMVPMNLKWTSNKAEYAIFGTWSQRALAEANKVYPEYASPLDWPKCSDSLQGSKGQDYLHYTSNETLEGRRNPTPPTPADGVPLIADMSSDLLTRPLPKVDFGLIYASTYRNAWAQGLTVVILSEELLGRSRRNSEQPDPKKPAVPSSLSYWKHYEGDPAAGTPPADALDDLYWAAAWIREEGGLEEMARRNEQKARALYAAIDYSDGFYKNELEHACRSHVNVVWNLPDANFEQRFLCEAKEWGLDWLLDQGVSIAGSKPAAIRASLYNFVSQEEVDYLVQFMDDFRYRHQRR